MSLSLIIVLVVLQVLIFMGLIFSLQRIFSRNVTSATKHLEDLGQDFNQKQDELKKKLDEAERVYQERILKAEEEANAIKQNLLKEAQEEREKIVRQARTQGQEIVMQADKASQSLIAESEEKIAKEAVNQAVNLIINVLPSQLQRQTHSQWIRELIENGFSQLDKLQVATDTAEIKIVSAFAITEEERQSIKDRLNQKLNRQVYMSEEVDPQLLAGIVLNIGSIVLDGSLRYKIQEEAKKQLIKGCT